MYWNSVQRSATTSCQKSRAENRSRSTTVPPPTSVAPVATTPPMLWYIGRQSYMPIARPDSIIPANQWLHCITGR